MKRRLRILTWHVHGNYLWYLSQVPHDFYVPYKPGRPPGYGGRGHGFPLGDNVVEVPCEEIPRLPLDCVLYQCRANYLHDRHTMLSFAQQRLPQIYLEHDPPLGHPTDTRHAVDDPRVLLVHVTAFNALMWDSGATPTRIIDHGVPEPPARYTGELARGLVVVNNLGRRGRRVGPDVFEQLRREVPLDLVGMNSEDFGGLGEVPPTQLATMAARYRFFFQPVRYTSLNLAVCEAMMLGMPIVGLATTELATVVRHGINGYLDTDPRRLVAPMRRLLDSPALAARLGRKARQMARRRFSLRRFVREWDATFHLAVEAARCSPGAKRQGTGVAG